MMCAWLQQRARCLSSHLLCTPGVLCSTCIFTPACVCEREREREKTCECFMFVGMSSDVNRHEVIHVRLQRERERERNTDCNMRICMCMCCVVLKVSRNDILSFVETIIKQKNAADTYVHKTDRYAERERERERRLCVHPWRAIGEREYLKSCVYREDDAGETTDHRDAVLCWFV